MRLRAVTWNIHGGLPVKTCRRSFEESLYILTSLEPDLVALQELEIDPSSGQFAGPSVDIVAATDLKYVATFAPSPSHHNERRQLAVALLSRWPLESIRRVRLPNPHLTIKSGELGTITTHDKGIVFANVQVGEKFFTSGSLHTYPFRRFGRRAHDPAFAPVWASLAHEFDQLARNMPIIIAGDFNTEDRELLFATLRRTKLYSAAGKVESRPWGDCYDDIIYTAQSFHPVASFAHETFSDHHIVVVDFSMDTPAQCRA